MSKTIRLPRESREWVGPLAITLTADGAPVADLSGVQVAVVPVGSRPASGDWVTPVVDPNAVATGVGIILEPAATWSKAKVWARIAGSIYLDDCGTIIRT